MILLVAPNGSEKQQIAHGAQLAKRAMVAAPTRSQSAAM
jgi:hypothetical protein